MGKIIKQFNNIVLLLNGEFPKHNYPLSLLKKSDFIICCDGSINKLEKFGLTCSLIIGDMDSIDNYLKNKYQQKLLIIERQTDTDLEKALKYCIENNLKKIDILGFSGNRDDHYISNIFTCFEYSSKINIKLHSDYGSFFFINQNQKFKSYKGQVISLFSISNNVQIKTKNLKYELNYDNLDYLYSGVSNESLSDEISINVKNGTIMGYFSNRRLNGKNI